MSAALSRYLMQIHLLFFSALLLTSITANAQSANFRAQGNYYSAKSNFQSGDYTEALNYVSKSKTALGGTNPELQYLHILSAYRLKKYNEAAKELQIFFNIEEKKTKAVYFDKSVERLTSDETKELSKMIDPILEAAEHLKNNPCGECHGTGMMAKIYNCSNCSGSGVIKGTCDGYCKDGKKDCQCNDKACTGSTSCSCWFGVHECTFGNIKCKTCKGSGKLNCNKCNGVGYKESSCNTCHSTGKLRSSTSKETCNKCYGQGFIK